MRTTSQLKSTVALMTFAFASAFVGAHAVPQSLTATVGDKPFVSDDDGINLIPVPIGSGSLSLDAITAGFSKYPPPPGLSDRIAVTCRKYEPKVQKFDATKFADGTCNASFTKGQSNQPFGKPQAKYVTKRDKGSAIKDSFFEITKISGKVVEGNFLFELVDEEGKDGGAGKKPLIVKGSFKAEDRQVK